jgi:hypothetical protein
LLFAYYGAEGAEQSATGSLLSSASSIGFKIGNPLSWLPGGSSS